MTLPGDPQWCVYGPTGQEKESSSGGIHNGTMFGRMAHSCAIKQVPPTCIANDSSGTLPTIDTSECLKR